METNPSQSTPPTHSFTITLPHFLVRWYHKLPTSTWRAALLLFAFGVGIGCGSLALNETLLWYRHRPLPPLPDRKWPEFNFPEYGLKAKLSTEWNEPLNELDFRLTLLPSDNTTADEFFARFSHQSWGATVKVCVYDKRHFVVAKSDEYLSLFTTIVDADNKKQRVTIQGKLFLSRDQYAALTGWDLTVSGLPPSNRNSATSNSPSKEDGNKPSDISQKKGGLSGESATNGLQGDDVLTGYSVMQSNLSTSGGLTFHLYKDAETGKAIEWGVDSARVHYECSPTLV